MEELITILKPEAMSTEKYPSISSVRDTSTARAIKEAVRSDLVARYTDPSIENMINIMAFLYPRYKELPLYREISFITFSW